MNRWDAGALFAGVAAVACAAAGEDPAWVLFLAASVIFYLASLVAAAPRR